MDDSRVKWIEEVGAEWFSNPARAVLMARLDHELLDAETIRYVGAGARAATQQTIADQQNCARAASLGLFTQPDPDLAARADQLKAFLDMLTTVVQHGGDPPAKDALRACALAILRGERDAQEGVILSADDVHQALAEVREFVQASAFNGTDAGAWLTRVGLFSAAMALPREQLLELAGRAAADEAPADPTEAARRSFAAIIKKVDALGASDPEKAESMLREALDSADATPEPDDDVDALMRILLLVKSHKLSPETLRRSVAQVGKLAEAGQSGDHVAVLASTLTGVVAASELSQELDAPIAKAGAKILEGEMTAAHRNGLTAAAARAWLRAGRPDQADRLLRALRKKGLDPAAALDVACVEADVRTDGGDRADAADVLVEALGAAKGLSFDERKMALQKVICLWPSARPGFEKWIGEYDAGVASMDEPMQTMARITLVLALKQSGDVKRALSLGRAIDFAALRSQLPKDFQSMAEEMESGFAAQMTELEKAAKGE
jgi:hypothetical protein